MGENRPSDVFFALWFYRSRGGPSITQEDFKVCAEAWRELRNREAEAEILRCAQDDGAAGGAEDPGDPSAAPRDDSNKAPRDGSNKAPDRWAAFKASAAARLAQAREDGVTFARIEEASGGALTMDGILLMAGAAKVPIEKWSKLDKALTALGYPRETGAAAPEPADTHTHTSAAAGGKLNEDLR